MVDRAYRCTAGLGDRGDGGGAQAVVEDDSPRGVQDRIGGVKFWARHGGTLGRGEEVLGQASDRRENISISRACTLLAGGDSSPCAARRGTLGAGLRSVAACLCRPVGANRLHRCLAQAVCRSRVTRPLSGRKTLTYMHACTNT